MSALHSSTVNRYQEIANVLVRHGLGYFLGVAGLDRYVPFHRRLLKHQRRPEPYTRPEHIRLALEELGPTFIKLGQILSTRPDLLPPEYQTELAKLQDAAPHVSIEAIRETLNFELGCPLEEVFKTFDPVPLAAASIGQAHAATLADGTQVVVKVRRPGASVQVEADLHILQNLAIRASRRWEAAEDYDLVGLVQEFARTLREELDYVHEGRNAERIAANFAGDQSVHIPCIFWDTTTARVITLEHIHGMKINDLVALDAAGVDRKELAKRACQITLKMAFEDGFFHADPHPGNFFVGSDGTIGLIDFGMVGIIDVQSRDQLAALLIAITTHDGGRLADAFTELGTARGHVDRAALGHDLQQLLAQYYGRPLGELALGSLLESTLATVRQHRLQLPTTLALVVKMVIMSEGMGAVLDPDFRLATILAPYAQKLMVEQLSPSRVAQDLAHSSVDLARLGMEAPEQVRRILRDIERGNLRIGVHPEGTERLMRHAEQLVNRLVLGVIAAAFIVGLAVLMAVYHPFGNQEWLGIFFVVGFTIAITLGGYLAWGALGMGRR